MSIARIAGQYGRGLRDPAPVPMQGINNADPVGARPSSDERFEALTKYIPTETITLFVAVLGAIGSVEAAQRPPYLLAAYLIFAVLTPILVWVVAYGSFLKPDAIAAAPAKAFPWPIFRMIAALVAFLVWALAVPGMADVFTAQTTLVQVISGVGALIVSTGLSVLEPIFEKSTRA